MYHPTTIPTNFTDMHAEPKALDTYRLARFLDRHNFDHTEVKTPFGARTFYSSNPSTLGDLIITAPAVTPELMSALAAGDYSLRYVFDDGDDRVKIWVTAD